MTELSTQPSFDGLIDLASGSLGGEAVEANDEFFAEKENLVKPSDAVFDPDRYTDRGKWMDGWETRRRRTPGHDWCVVRLGVPGVIHRLAVDTRHFRGNHPEACSVEARPAGGGDWREILPRSDLTGDFPNAFDVPDGTVYEAVRLNIYPDGGVARLRVFGRPRPAWDELATAGRVDLAAATHGGAPLACSDRFFSDPSNLLKPGPSSHMGDGWETRRRRGPGHDWVVLRLGCRGAIESVAVDTSHFKGNYPATCSLEVCDVSDPGPEPAWDEQEWVEVLPQSGLGPDGVHEFGVSAAPGTYVRFHIYPDGGVARLRLYGRPVP